MSNFQACSLFGSILSGRPGCVWRDAIWWHTCCQQCIWQQKQCQQTISNGRSCFGVVKCKSTRSIGCSGGLVWARMLPAALCINSHHRNSRRYQLCKVPKQNFYIALCIVTYIYCKHRPGFRVKQLKICMNVSPFAFVPFWAHKMNICRRQCLFHCIL